MSKTAVYLSDVLNARATQRLAEQARWAKQDAKAAKFEVAQNLHHAIGALMTAKGVKYYAYIRGQYTEGTVEQLTSDLAA